MNTVLLQQTAKKKITDFVNLYSSLTIMVHLKMFPLIWILLFVETDPPLFYLLTAFVILISAFVRKKKLMWWNVIIYFFISIIKLNNRSFLQISRIFPPIFLCGILTSLNVVYSWKWRSAREESRLRLITDGILITMRIGQECRFGWEGRRRLWVWCTVEGSVESENVRWPA